MRSIRSITVLCAASAAVLCGQQGTVAGAVAGYAYDSRAKTLRVIHGVPGASLIGGALDLGTEISNAWVAPQLDTVLATTAEGAARLYRLDAGTAAERRVDGLIVPERAIFSPSGTALALVTAGTVQIMRGLPDAPAVAGTDPMPHGRSMSGFAMAGRKLLQPGRGAVAVSDDGQYLLFATGTTVDVLGLRGDSRQLTDAAAGAAVAFAPGGHDAAVVDGESVKLFQDVAGAATVRRLPGIAAARGVAFSPDGRKLFIAGAELNALDLATGDRVAIECGCTPTGLTPMGSAYRLNEISADPLWLLEISAQPKTVFVPASR